jgi:hypothetical protein
MEDFGMDELEQRLRRFGQIINLVVGMLFTGECEGELSADHDYHLLD